MAGGSVTGYSEAKVRKTVDICAHGAAHGAWKEMMRRVEAGRAATWARHSSSVVISLIVDIVKSGRQPSIILS